MLPVNENSNNLILTIFQSIMDRQIKKKKWTLKRISIFTISGVFVIFVFYNIIFGDHSSKLNVKKERITISTVERGLFQEFIPVTGNVVPIKTFYLDAIEGGRVEKIFVEAGTFVNQGDSLLKLANTNLLLDIMYREAELFQQSNNLEIEYQLKTQKRIYENAVELHEKNLISEKEFDEAKDNYEFLESTRDLKIATHAQDSIYREVQVKQLEAGLDRMNANLEIVKQNLENLVLRAPISGDLTSLNAEIGENKVRGERLGQIDVLDGFKILVGVDEKYISRINLGLGGEFTFAGETYHLTIKKIYPEVLNGRFEVDMEFPGEEPAGIRRGQTVHIRLELGDLSEAILLDRGGFYQKTGGQWVYLVDESGEFAYKRKVKIGRQNPDVFEVLDGLEIGEKVITSSYDTYENIDKLILK